MASRSTSCSVQIDGASDRSIASFLYYSGLVGKLHPDGGGDINRKRQSQKEKASRVTQLHPRRDSSLITFYAVINNLSLSNWLLLASSHKRNQFPLDPTSLLHRLLLSHEKLSACFTHVRTNAGLFGCSLYNKANKNLEVAGVLRPKIRVLSISSKVTSVTLWMELAQNCSSAKTWWQRLCLLVMVRAGWTRRDTHLEVRTQVV